MSETVRYIGKIKLSEKLTNETLEEQCERIARANNLEHLRELYDDWQEVIRYELEDIFVIHNDKVYVVLEQKDADIHESVFKGLKNKDRTINYDVMYYNGGCSFDEAIGRVLDSMEED